jgi:tRNA modification GTPase
MNARVCVTTARIPAAIAAIRLEGPDAAGILRAIMRPPSGKPPALKPGDIAVADVVDGPDTIDHIVVACRHPDAFDINCHGNPLIVQMIMKLLKARGVRVISAEQMLCDRLRPQCENTIELEAHLQQLTAATVPGAKLIAAQGRTGLAAAAKQWSESVETTPLESIRRQARDILRRGRIARPLIQGCKIVIAGPPNSGKSTLLNTLAGRPQAIVADVPGTTRDWVTAACRVGPLAVEFVDTAGLDPTWRGHLARDSSWAHDSDTVDRAAQAATVQLLTDCDLVLYVIDASQPGPIEPIPTKSPIIVVFNKSDLPARTTPDDLAFQPAAAVTVSALASTGLNTLADAIQTTLAVNDLNPADPTCFTGRQTDLLTQLADTSDKYHALCLISELLSGYTSVP